QFKGHQFQDCFAVGGQYGVYTNASLSWHGGLMGVNRVSDFRYNGSIGQEPLLIEGMHSEHSARLIETGGPAGLGAPITIENVRWSSESLNADNRAIVSQFGDLNLIGNSIQSISSPISALELYCNPAYDSNSEPIGGCVATGNHIVTSLTNPYTG